jgi:pilus assembly protein Flp/PilA
MRPLAQHLVGFLKNDNGATAVEYAVMLALIIVVCIAAVITLGHNASGTFGFVAAKASAS